MAMLEGMELRRERPDDAEFLKQLFYAVRSPEFGAAGWPEEQTRDFLAIQERMQWTHYDRTYKRLERWIVERNGRSIGRLYLATEPDALRVVEISIMPEDRGRGLGSGLLRSVLEQASAAGLDVVLSVDRGNRAEGLYRRMGFEAVRDEGMKTGMRWRGPAS
ncbi:GNAT family N-acetyltransferase [Terriglobus albidus]|nr:GNAT family N-acetyltransferase [Terriglobus albidus]